MKFQAKTSVVTDERQLEEEYRSAREIGPVRVGETCLFIRKMTKIEYIPYKEITRCFRRVNLVQASLCCGKGDLQFEHLVIWVGDQELMQVKLPDARAGKALLEELKKKIPHAEFTCPQTTCVKEL